MSDDAVIDPPLMDSDAMAWAVSFVSYARRNPAIATDKGTMIGWFANAMAAAEREAYERGQRDASMLLGGPGERAAPTFPERATHG